MSDPTRIDAGATSPDQPLYGALVRIHIVGNADGILTLPSTIKDDAAAHEFLFKLGMRMADPKSDLSEQEASFVHALFQTAQALMGDGLEWKVLRTFTPSELANVMQAARRRTV